MNDAADARGPRRPRLHRGIRALTLLALLAGILASFMIRSETPAPTPLPRIAAVPAPEATVSTGVLESTVPPQPPPKPGADRYYDGRTWRDLYWAADEAHLTMKSGAARPAGFQALGNHPTEVTVRTAKVERDQWPARAAELRALPGVRDVLPVFYPSADAMQRRAAPRLFLTNGVLVTLPPEAKPAAVAARSGAVIGAKLDFLPNTYVFRAPGPFETFDVALALKSDGAVRAVPQFAMLPELHGIPPNDPEYPNQWHLKNTGQGGGVPGEDVKAEAAWAVTLGAGTVIGVVDTGVQTGHPDLAPNYLASASFDFDDSDGDPNPVDATENHATAVAGVAAARGDNGIGVSGIAPMAQLAGLRLLFGMIDDATIASAMSFKKDVITVKNNSWGFKSQTDPSLDSFPHAADLAAIKDGFLTGRGGKGAIYVFSAGNGALAGDDANYSSYCTMRQVITVGAVSNLATHAVYSNPGAPLLVVTQSGGGTGSTLNIQTTDRTGTDGYVNAASPAGDYTGTGTNGFSGTSSAAPLVSGVVALMISANPNLSSRDVEHVLVRSARKVAPADPSWFVNGGGFNCSHLFGHGAVDAGAAVALSKTFPYAGPVSLVGSSSTFTTPIAIPDGPGTYPSAPAFGAAATDTLTLPSAGALRVEHVEVFFNATHPFRGDLRVRLTHNGVTSVLANARTDSGANYGEWMFMSTMHWGESSAGDWILSVDDGFNSLTGTFDSWRIHIWGPVIDTTPPVAGTVRDGPAADQQTQESTTSFTANWIGFNDPESGIVFEMAIGSTPGATDIVGFFPVGYATTATAGGLTLIPGATYYATVRATNFEGLTTTVTSDGVRVLPDTTITGFPSDPSGVISPSFTFSANQAGCSFFYSLDGGAAVSNGTATSVVVGPLGAGSHTFSVYAVSGIGDADPTPATYTWNLPVPVSDGLAPLINSFDQPLFLTNWTASSTGAPAWDIDGTPAVILSIAPPYVTGTASLNYNNGTNYDTGGVSNSGIITSPVIDVSALPAGSCIKFFCNYDTDTPGTATDQRRIMILNPAQTVTLASVQLSTGGSAAGPCAAAGLWHEHVLPIQAAWGTSFRVRFSFDTMTALNNLGAGWFLDDLELSDLDVSGLAQYVGTSQQVLPVGGSTTTQAIRIQGLISQAAPGTVMLEVEVQPANVAFTGTPTASATSAGAGNSLSVLIGAPPGDYHWRARTRQLPGTTSGWMDFGLNTATAPDFIITAVPPPPSGGGGHGGGCGATGLEWLAVAGLLLLRRRRS